MTDGENTQQARDCRGGSGVGPTGARRVIHATCTTHGGARSFANLVMRKRPDGRIELDAHATGGCVLELEEDGAVEVRDQLVEWLG